MFLEAFARFRDLRGLGLGLGSGVGGEDGDWAQEKLGTYGMHT